MNTDLLREYAELRRAEKSSKEEMEDLKERADKLEEELLEQFGNEGVPRMTINVDGEPFTVYLYSQLWASPREKTDMGRAALADALRSIGEGHMVQPAVNHQTLSGFVRDLEQAGKPLPDVLEKVISVNHTHKLRVRRG